MFENCLLIEIILYSPTGGSVHELTCCACLAAASVQCCVLARYIPFVCLIHITRKYGTRFVWHVQVPSYNYLCSELVTCTVSDRSNVHCVPTVRSRAKYVLVIFTLKILMIIIIWFYTNIKKAFHSSPLILIYSSILALYRSCGIIIGQTESLNIE